MASALALLCAGYCSQTAATVAMLVKARNAESVKATNHQENNGRPQKPSIVRIWRKQSVEHTGGSSIPLYQSYHCQISICVPQIS